MKEFMSYLIIIAIIAFIGFICYMVVRKSNAGSAPVQNFPEPPAPGGYPTPQPNGYPTPQPNGYPTPQPVSPSVDPQASPNPYNDDEGEETGIFTEWAVVQLDPHSGSPVKKKNLTVSEKGRFTVGRNKSCDFVLEGATAQDYVSRFHLGVGKDENGYFAKPLSRDDGSMALTYIEGQLIVGTFDLAEKQVIWLGNVPIAFVRNEDLRSDLRFNPGSNDRDKQSFERDYENTMTFSPNNRAQENDENIFSR